MYNFTQMKQIAIFLTSSLLLIGCSIEDPEPITGDPVITFKNLKNKNLFDGVKYHRDSIRYYSTVSDKRGEVDNFLECDTLFVLPTVSDVVYFLDFGNRDIDTITYKWDGGYEDVAELRKLNWLEVYYNHKVVKRWEFADIEDRSEFSRNHCNYYTCYSDCNSPDVIEIIKE